MTAASRRGGRGRTRPAPIHASHAGRPPPLQRGIPHAPLREDGRPPRVARQTPPARTSRSSLRKPRPCRSSATSTGGTREATPCFRGRARAPGRDSCRTSARAPFTSTTSVRGTAATRWTRPTRSPSFASSPPKTGAIVWDLSYEWGDATVDGGARGRPTAEVADVRLRAAPRLVAPPRRTDAELPRDRPAAGGVCPRPRLHPRRAPARDGAPLLRIVGLPADRLLRPDEPLRNAAGPHVPDRPPAPARGRRDPRLGPVALPVRRARPRFLRRQLRLRARRSRARRTSPTGEASSSTSAGPRCGASSCRAPSSGSRSTTPTGCGWTRWRRCSTSTTRARRGSGRPTATAGGRTSERSTSCGGSTRRSTARSRAPRRSRRNRRPGRWSPGRRGSAASVSA